MNSENAAARDNFVSEIHARGIAIAKEEVLQSLPTEMADAHRSGAIHIHDLESFGVLNNCSTPPLGAYLRSLESQSASATGKVFEAFEMVKHLVTELANCQSGGIGFGNFDVDLGGFLESEGIELDEVALTALEDAMAQFITWANTMRTRNCRETYYMTLNIGLAQSRWGRAVARCLLESLLRAPRECTKPNVVFKVKRSVNCENGSVNRDLLDLALQCTAKRMVPTYLLMDSAVNAPCDPERLNIMGCRTRVYDNVNGAPGSVGRGNIACVSINLPRIALEAGDVDSFFVGLRELMELCSRILELRRERFVRSDGKHVQETLARGLWGEAENVRDMADQGTYSIGFIGLSEAVEILHGSKPCFDPEADTLARKVVERMREFTDGLRAGTHQNWSLLASAGELISGRFCKLDAGRFAHPVMEKRFYTNSFHADVDSRMSPFDKIGFEGPFHALCNGGAITYVELSSAVIGNTDALDDLLAYATAHGVSYLGFNFPLDICNDCGETGTFDSCPSCGSTDIKRIRRVSGYLEDVAYFTDGKRAEVARRHANLM